MRATLVVDERFIECELNYPHRPDPILIPLPGGGSAWQPSPFARHDILIVLPRRGPLLLAGTVEILTETMQFTVLIETQKVDQVYGSLVTKQVRRTSATMNR